MKLSKSIFLALSILLVATSCFEDKEIFFTGTQIEFERAVMTAPATGQNFPIFNLTRASGTISEQVNLISKQFAADETIQVSLDEVPASLLNATTIAAVEDVHFTLQDTFVFPAEASKVNYTGLSIIPGFPAQAGITALLIVKLDGNDKVKPAENFRRIGFRISLN